MADITNDRRSGPAGNRAPVRQHDEADGTFSESTAAHVRGWDATDLAWNRLPVDHTTGALKVYTAGSAAGGGSAVTVADGADVAQGTTSDVAWVSGSGTVISLLKKIASAGGSAVSIADAADVAEGATTDAAVVTDTTGTVSGKLRGLVKWAFERMPASLGQKAMAASLPVVLASDQASIPVTAAALTDATQKTKIVDTGGVNVASVSAAGAVKVDANQGTAAATAGAWPVQIVNTGGNIGSVDGSGRQYVRNPNAAEVDYDSGAGTVNQEVIGIALPGAGGPVAGGTATAPVRTDPTGTTAQPITDNAGSLTVDAPVGTPVFSRLSDGAAALIGQKAMAASLPVVIASDQATFPVTATGPTLTKGTQAATGYSVQDLKDSGRVNIMWTAEFTHAQTAETLLTLTESRDGAATTTFSSKVVTSGKRLRITSVHLEVETLGSGTAPQRAYLRMRFNTAGAATTASALQAVWACANNPAVVKTATSFAQQMPDGVEYLGDGTKQIGFSLETPDWVATTATGRAKVTITAFEY